MNQETPDSPNKNELMLKRIAYLEQALGNYGDQIRALNDAVSSVQIAINQTAPSSSTTIESLLKSRRLFEPITRSNLSTTLPIIRDGSTFEQQLDELKSFGYGAYSEWFKLLEPNLVSYNEDPEAGISVEENAGARLFRDFLSPYAQGSVLDIGCGIAKLPTYLSDFNLELVCGSDPLLPDLERDFSFYHGLAETLPWQDQAFDNVIIATSMDHFLDPVRALSEAQRVLKLSGKLLLWMGFVQNSIEYDPMDFNITPIDDYHLFHFSQTWFETMLNKQFQVVEKIDVNHVSSFYACSPLET